MSDLFTPTPRARASDPHTSQRAATQAAKWCRSHYEAIMAVLWKPMIPPHIAKLTGLTVVQIDRRRKELLERGDIRLTGREIDGYAEWEKVIRR